MFGFSALLREVEVLIAASRARFVGLIVHWFREIGEIPYNRAELNSLMALDHVGLEMRQCLANDGLGGLAVLLYFAQKHRALDRRDAKVDGRIQSETPKILEALKKISAGA